MNRRSLTVLPLLLAFAVLPSAAVAAGTSTTPTSTTPTPAPPPAPAGGTLTLIPQQVNGGQKAVLSGQRWTVVGKVSQYVAGQNVIVRFYLGNKKLKVQQVAILRRGATGGGFTIGFTTNRPGRIRVAAVHKATPEQKTMRSRPFHVQVVPLAVNPGSGGLAVRLLQSELSAKGYVVGQRGVFDARTQRAVMAFRKVAGMARTFSADASVFRALARGAGTFKVRFPSHGRHVEGDLTHQVLALIGAGGKVERLYMMSSGKPSTPTVLGSFRVYSKTPGTNDHGMVYSNYFIRGYAIHGYVDVPAYAASHGCLRVPIPDAISIYGWVQYGTPVDVYYR